MKFPDFKSLNLKEEKILSKCAHLYFRHDKKKRSEMKETTKAIKLDTPFQGMLAVWAPEERAPIAVNTEKRMLWEW